MDADAVIFDPQTIKDKATFEQPTLSPEGISHMIINGEIAVENNQVKHGRLGKFVRYN
ncbi:MAG: Dihydroorotase [Clostridiales bacterium 38_11]|nr:MAG: Dihydroorotase [Clostridiales bacterium 38_11]